jgi:hypothetical protein
MVRGEMDKVVRYAVVSIEATEEYLTDKGEESAEAGWEIIEIEIDKYLGGFNRFADPKVPNARFIEWEESDA